MTSQSAAAPRSGVALVTGLTGQDGGYLAELLVGQGWQVHGVLRPGESLPEHLIALGDQVTPHELELTDGPALTAVLDEVAPDEVYNLAGISSVALSWAEPVATVEVNGLAVARLLEGCWQLQERTGRPVRLVQASSAELFAGTTQVPQDETTPVQPRSPYGASKALAHHLVGVYRARGLHASAAVLYNHESPRRPPAFVTRKITAGAAAIATGRASELVLGALDVRRDWGWAPEYVQAMVLAARHPEPGDYVVATGVSHTVREFVATAFAAAGLPDWERYVRTDAAFARPTDAVDLVGDPSHAEAVLGWSPTVGFTELVQRMVQHDLTAD